MRAWMFKAAQDVLLGASLRGRQCYFPLRHGGSSLSSLWSTSYHQCSTYQRHKHVHLNWEAWDWVIVLPSSHCPLVLKDVCGEGACNISNNPENAVVGRDCRYSDEPDGLSDDHGRLTSRHYGRHLCQWVLHIPFLLHPHHIDDTPLLDITHNPLPAKSIILNG